MNSESLTRQNDNAVNPALITKASDKITRVEAILKKQAYGLALNNVKPYSYAPLELEHIKIITR